MKPALPYSDVIRLLRDNSSLPIAAYQVILLFLFLVFLSFVYPFMCLLFLFFFLLFLVYEIFFLFIKRNFLKENERRKRIDKKKEKLRNLLVFFQSTVDQCSYRG